MASEIYELTASFRRGGLDGETIREILLSTNQWPLELIDETLEETSPLESAGEEDVQSARLLLAVVVAKNMPAPQKPRKRHPLLRIGASATLATAIVLVSILFLDWGEAL